MDDPISRLRYGVRVIRASENWVYTHRSVLFLRSAGQALSALVYLYISNLQQDGEPS